MTATIATPTKNALLDGMLRATSSAAPLVGQILLANSGGTSLLKFKTLSGTGSEWGTPANGTIALQGTPMLTTQVGNGTIVTAGVEDTGGINPVVSPYTMSAGLAGSGFDIDLDSDTVTAGSAVNITNFQIALKEFVGTVCTNTLLRNRILSFFTQKNKAVFSGAGTITVYSGTPPANAEASPTGTQLVQFATTTTSWAAAASGSSVLAASLAAAAIASGTPGYARFVWSNGTETYVVQGTCGTSGTDFVIDASPLVSGTTYHLTAATMAL